MQSATALPAPEMPRLQLLEESEPTLLAADYDKATVMLTCANCGAEMVERKCKLICRCGYFLSCSDYY